MIIVKNVNHSYQRGTPFERNALRNVSIEINEGECTAVAGLTGSGKSTLIQIIAGLIKTSSGVIEIDGLPVSDRRIRRLVGFVFQYPEHQLFEETIEKDIAFGLRNLNLTETEISRRVDEVMKFLSLDPEMKKCSPFEISGGEQRRVALAGVLILKPKYLILDEPTAGLDPRTSEELLKKLFDEIKKIGITIIFVSHNMEDILRFADRVIILSKGEILFEGSPKTFFMQEKLLKISGLKLPPLMQLVYELSHTNLKISRNIFTLEELEWEILRVFGKSLK